MKRHTRLAFLAMGLWVAACGDEADGGQSDPSNDPPLLGSPRRSGEVGQGYDSINRTIQPMYCIQPASGGSWREVGLPSSTISMTLQSDREKLARSIGIDVEISYGIASAAASFFRETESDDFSVAYVFGGTMDFKDVQVSGNYEINPLLQNADPVEWYRLCGDSYIQSIRRGAGIYAGLRFHFSSRSEKQQFQSKFKISGGLSASAALQAAKQVSQQNVAVTVTALQVGGDVTQLTRALSGADAASCSLGDVSQCLRYLNTIESYASKTFPAQFRDAAGKPLTGAALEAMTATTGYVQQPWTTLAIPQFAGLSSKPEAKKLLNLYLKQFAIQEKLDAILGLPLLARRGEETADLQRSVLEDLSVQIAQNLRALDQAWTACYPNPTSGCSAAIQTAEASLAQPDPHDLMPWFDMRYPDGAPGNPLDLVDIDGDGSVDLCFRDLSIYSTSVQCLMGVGLGFEEMPSRWIDHGEKALMQKPWAWVDLGGEYLGVAFCGPPNLSQPLLHCIPVDNGTLRGTVLFMRANNGVVTIRTPLNAKGVDGKRVYEQAAQAIHQRWPGSWPNAF